MQFKILSANTKDMIFVIAFYLAVAYRAEGCIISNQTISIGWSELNLQNLTTKNQTFQQTLQFRPLRKDLSFALADALGDASVFCPYLAYTGATRVFSVSNCTASNSAAFSSSSGVQHMPRVKFLILARCYIGVFRALVISTNMDEVLQGSSQSVYVRTASSSLQSNEIPQLHCAFRDVTEMDISDI
ncbi:hypothetical protein Aperf_G00000046097 [Anoplocephala perfoliata]